MSNDLRGQFIANTFQNLVQMPDVSKQNFYNGIGATISVINKDGIGTIKMFYPPSGNILDYFDNSGDGIVGTEWEGWKICLGSNGTPDLRGRFILGYDNRNFDPSNGIWDISYNIIGSTGGEKSVTLSEGQMPRHKHTTTLGADKVIQDAFGSQFFRLSTSDGSTTRDTDEKGNNEAHENRPPYMTVCYVMRVT